MTDSSSSMIDVMQPRLITSHSQPSMLRDYGFVMVDYRPGTPSRPGGPEIEV